MRELFCSYGGKENEEKTEIKDNQAEVSIAATDNQAHAHHISNCLELTYLDDSSLSPITSLELSEGRRHKVS